MNISIYLPQKLVSKLSQAAYQHHSSKNAIVKEALEEFQAVKETPNFPSD